jgi:hypothetical protein
MWNVKKSAEQERSQKLLAKLSVTGPELAFPVTANRQMIDKQRARTVKLNIVRGRVRQGKTLGQEVELQIQMEKRCVLEQ